MTSGTTQSSSDKNTSRELRWPWLWLEIRELTCQRTGRFQPQKIGIYGFGSIVLPFLGGHSVGRVADPSFLMVWRANLRQSTRRILLARPLRATHDESSRDLLVWLYHWPSGQPQQSVVPVVVSPCSWTVRSSMEHPQWDIQMSSFGRACDLPNGGVLQLGGIFHDWMIDGKSQSLKMDDTSGYHDFGNLQICQDAVDVLWNRPCRGKPKFRWWRCQHRA